MNLVLPLKRQLQKRLLASQVNIAQTQVRSPEPIVEMTLDMEGSSFAMAFGMGWATVELCIETIANHCTKPETYTRTDY